MKSELIRGKNNNNKKMVLYQRIMFIDGVPKITKVHISLLSLLLVLDTVITITLKVYRDSITNMFNM